MLLSRARASPLTDSKPCARDGGRSLIAASQGMGFPLLVKAVAGGGGKGMKLAMTAAVS